MSSLIRRGVFPSLIWLIAVPVHANAADAGSTAGTPAAPAPMYWSACQIQRLAPGAISVSAGPYNTYFSDVFPADLKTSDGAAYRDYFDSLMKSFDAFIDTTHGTERDSPQCNIMTSEEKLRAFYKTWSDEANKIGKAIMTGWKYPGK